MDEMDNIEKKFNEAFSGYAKEPPGMVWDRIQSELHPDLAPRSLWDQIVFFPQRSPRLFRFGIAIAAASVMIFFISLYFGSGGRHMLRGHAYAGEARLCKGTAYLFRVNDKSSPLDSIEHIRSARVNEDGAYHFSGVESGKYLLRVSPDASSEEDLKYHASWHEQHRESDSAHLLIIESGDVHADVHLVEKR